MKEILDLGPIQISVVLFALYFLGLGKGILFLVIFYFLCEKVLKMFGYELLGGGDIGFACDTDSVNPNNF